MKDNVNLTNEIAAYDRVFGEIAYEARVSADKGMPLAALSCLFILVEQSLKYYHDNFDGNFSKLIKNTSILSSDEKKLLDSVRILRNNLFHGYHHALFYEIAGILYPMNESDNQLLFFQDLFEPCLKIILKLLKNKE